MVPIRADDDTFGEAFTTAANVTGFVRAMTGYSMGAHLALTSAFDWSGVREVVDVGCAEGAFLAHMLRAHPHLRGIGFDRPEVADRFQGYVATAGIEDRARLATETSSRIRFLVETSLLWAMCSTTGIWTPNGC